MDNFLTIENESKGIYKEKRSSFIGLLFPVNNQEEIKNILKQIRKEYYDAHHHCYAYRILDDSHQIIEYCSYDVEPANTAGIQILYELRKAQLLKVSYDIVKTELEQLNITIHAQ